MIEVEKERKRDWLKSLEVDCFLLSKTVVEVVGGELDQLEHEQSHDDEKRKDLKEEEEVEPGVGERASAAVAAAVVDRPELLGRGQLVDFGSLVEDGAAADHVHRVECVQEPRREQKLAVVKHEHALDQKVEHHFGQEHD